MKLKVGMMVRCTKPYDGNFDIIGKIGKIIYICNCRVYGVEFIERIEKGHGCNGRGKYGYCWNMAEHCIIPYDSKQRIK